MQNTNIKLGWDDDKMELFGCGTLRRFLLVAGVIGFSLFGLGMMIGVAGSGPNPGFKPLDQHGHMQISAQDRCPVCAMKVSAHKKFAGAIQLSGGQTFYFCGTGCMIRSWMHPEIFLNASKTELNKSVVQEYFSGRQVDGLAVYWVAGSDVVGPMGPALVPIMDERQVEVFKNRHGGKAVFRLSEITDEKWLQLTGKKAVPQK